MSDLLQPFGRENRDLQVQLQSSIDSIVLGTGGDPLSVTRVPDVEAMPVGWPARRWLALIARLADSESLHRASARSIEEGMWVLGCDDTVSFVNPQMASILGRPEEEIVGRRPGEFVLASAARDRTMKSAQRERAFSERYEAKLRRRDESIVPVLISWSPLYDDHGAYLGALGLCYDLSGRSHQQDFTGAALPSVAEGIYLIDPGGRLTFMNPEAERLLGYSSDELLGKVAHEVIHSEEVDGRPLTADRCPMQAVLRTGVNYRIDDDIYRCKDGHRLPVSVSCAPVMAPDGRRGGVIAFRDITQRKAAERRLRVQLEGPDWLARIREALSDDRFVIYGQPIIALDDGHLVSTELLLRMRDSHGKIVAPGEFLPAAERSGLITEIDRWVIGQAARYAAAGHTIEVNVSAHSIADPELVQHIARMLEQADAPAHRLIFELTETAFMEDRQSGIAFGQGIAALGCELALDDFGTGYGTFTYLKHLPLRYLKIDREFVTDLKSSQASQHVVNAVVSIAKDFGLQTIAEGVEDPDTLQLLTTMQVDSAQGFHIARPHPLTLETAT